MHIPSLFAACAALQIFQVTLAAPSANSGAGVLVARQGGDLEDNLDDLRDNFEGLGDDIQDAAEDALNTVTGGAFGNGNNGNINDDDDINGDEGEFGEGEGDDDLLSNFGGANSAVSSGASANTTGSANTTSEEGDGTYPPGADGRTANDIVIINGGWEPIQGNRVPARMELTDMINNNAEGFSLYVQALDEIQKRPTQDPMSYVQLCGIHGAPINRAWNNNPGKNETFGYCHHNNPNFPTWHRPYLLSYEQALYEVIQRICAKWPRNSPSYERMQAAGRVWRMPYWDWAAQQGPSPMPSQLTSNQISIITPQGQQTIRNPLRGYTFTASDRSFMTQATMQDIFAGGQVIRENQNNINSLLNTERNNLQNSIQRLFTQSPTWNIFSNKQSFQNPNTFSIEYVHDLVHMHVGIRGNSMASPSSAAFDPIFWLHHTFADKLLWEWQRITGGWIGDLDFELRPFRKSENEYWTNGDCRSTEAMGYTYAPLGAEGPNEVDNTPIPDRYPGFYGPLRDAEGNGNNGNNNGNGRDDGITGDSLRPVIDKIVKDGVFYEWSAYITIDTNKFGGPVNVYAYMGDGDEDNKHDITNFMYDKEFAGRYSTFSWMKGKSIYASIPLTEVLLKRVSKDRLDSLLEKEGVKSYLEKMFEYVVTDMKGDVVASTDGCKIEIVEYEVRLPKERSALPKYEEPKPVYVPKPAPKEKFIYKAPPKEEPYVPTRPAPPPPKNPEKPVTPPKDSYAPPPKEEKPTPPPVEESPVPIANSAASIVPQLSVLACTALFAILSL